MTTGSQMAPDRKYESDMADALSAALADATQGEIA